MFSICFATPRQEAELLPVTRDWNMQFIQNIHYKLLFLLQ